MPGLKMKHIADRKTCPLADGSGVPDHMAIATSHGIAQASFSSARREISSQTLSELESQAHPSINTTYYTHPASLKAGGGPLLLWQDLAGRKNALFSDFGAYLHCCNRLDEFSSTTLGDISRALFSSTSAAFVIFEDIHLKSDAKMDFPSLSFSYQENWCREISPGMKYFSRRRRSVLRRRMKKLLATIRDDDIVFEFRRCTAEDIDTIIAMNAKTLASKGKRHHPPEQLLKQVCAESGYLAALYADGHLIAGDIVSVIEDQAYFNISGYDLAWRDFSPGMLVHERIIEKCIELGCTRVNFLWGNSTWKTDVGSTRVPLTTLVVGRNVKSFASRRLWLATYPYVKQAGKTRIKRMAKFLCLA